MDDCFYRLKFFFRYLFDPPPPPPPPLLPFHTQSVQIYWWKAPVLFFPPVSTSLVSGWISWIGAALSSSQQQPAAQQPAARPAKRLTLLNNKEMLIMVAMLWGEKKGQLAFRYTVIMAVLTRISSTQCAHWHLHFIWWKSVRTSKYVKAWPVNISVTNTNEEHHTYTNKQPIIVSTIWNKRCDLGFHLNVSLKSIFSPNTERV